MNGRDYCSERISPFIHSFCEDKILIFSSHNLALYVSLFLTKGLLLENIGECIKTLPCGLQQNNHGHEIFLNRIKDNIIGILFILLEVYSPFIGGSLLYHYGYITNKVILFKNIQHPCLPCVEVGSTFKAIFRSNGYCCHGCNILFNTSISM